MNSYQSLAMDVPKPQECLGAAGQVRYRWTSFSLQREEAPAAGSRPQPKIESQH